MREHNIEFIQKKLVLVNETLKEFEYAESIKNKLGVKIGMTKKQVLENTNWGKPKSINTTTSKYDVREQWVYEDSNYLYFLNGKLETIQN